MKQVTILLAAITLLFIGWKTDDSDCKNSVYLLKQVKKIYDQNDAWERATLKVHLQEPRVQNPQRFSKVTLDNDNNYFELERYRPDGIEKRIIDSEGNAQFGFNDSSDIPTEITQKYGLNLARSKGYRNFYKTFYGLPMNLSDDFWSKINPAEKVIFEGQEAYRISLELKEPMISQYWTLIFKTDDYQLLALEFNHPDEPEKETEIIKFSGIYEFDGIKIPRMRHWYIKETDEYLGSDIIVETLE